MTNEGELGVKVHSALWKRISTEGIDAAAKAIDFDSQIRELIADYQPLASPSTIESVVADVLARVDGLGPLHELASDTAISEIMVNGDGRVWVERSGRIEQTSLVLAHDDTHNLVRRLAATAGRRIDQTHPSVDVRLADGSRLHAIIPPLAVDGPCVTIRRFRDQHIALDELASPTAQHILERATADRETIVIAGATSSGKTTLLNALATSIPDEARIITIEDAAELRLPSKHVVRLETRAATEGAPAVTLRELARHALRMRPDRIICGEMRGAEALDLIQAMNTGHRGSMSTVHANSPADALRRIETMMLLGDAELPLSAIRDQLASCIDLVVMMGRAESGARQVTEIARLVAESGDRWTLEVLFSHADLVVNQ